jgi:ABC-type glycerol-3-phosphate transport system substrate-binding protein
LLLIRSATAAAALSPVLAACGGAAEQPSARLDGPATVKVLSFNNPLFQQPKDALLGALAQSDSGLKPDVIVFPGQIGEFRLKAVATYAGGDIPDAQWIHPSITSLLGSRKLVRPLEELSRRDAQTRIGDFYPGIVEYFRWNGATYGLPWYSPGFAYVYNKTLFERLGVTLPDRLEQQRNWTWETFVTTLRSLTRGPAGSPDRTIGMHAESTNLDWICAWIWRHGGDVFNKDSTKCVLNEPAAVEAIQNIADLYLRHQVINYGPHTQDFPEGFLSGRVGLRQANKEATAPDRNDIARASFALGLAPASRGKAGRPTRIGTLAFGAAQNGPNGDAGWRWVRFMGGPQAAEILMDRRATLPVRPAFAKLPAFDRSMADWENRDVWLDSQASARALQQPASYDEIATLWTATWRDILDQKGNTKALLDDLVSRANALLAQEQPAQGR